MVRVELGWGAYRFIDLVFFLLFTLIFPLPVLFGVSHFVRLE